MKNFHKFLSNLTIVFNKCTDFECQVSSCTSKYFSRNVTNSELPTRAPVITPITAISATPLIKIDAKINHPTKKPTKYGINTEKYKIMNSISGIKPKITIKVVFKDFLSPLSTLKYSHKNPMEKPAIALPIGKPKRARSPDCPPIYPNQRPGSIPAIRPVAKPAMQPPKTAAMTTPIFERSKAMPVIPPEIVSTCEDIAKRAFPRAPIIAIKATYLEVHLFLASKSPIPPFYHNVLDFIS